MPIPEGGGASAGENHIRTNIPTPVAAAPQETELQLQENNNVDPRVSELPVPQARRSETQYLSCYDETAPAEEVNDPDCNNDVDQKNSNDISSKDSSPLEPPSEPESRGPGPGLHKIASQRRGSTGGMGNASPAGVVELSQKMAGANSYHLSGEVKRNSGNNKSPMHPDDIMPNANNRLSSNPILRTSSSLNANLKPHRDSAATTVYNDNNAVNEPGTVESGGYLNPADSEP